MARYPWERKAEMSDKGLIFMEDLQFRKVDRHRELR